MKQMGLVILLCLTVLSSFASVQFTIDGERAYRVVKALEYANVPAYHGSGLTAVYRITSLACFGTISDETVANCELLVQTIGGERKMTFAQKRGKQLMDALREAGAIVDIAKFGETQLEIRGVVMFASGQGIEQYAGEFVDIRQ